VDKLSAKRSIKLIDRAPSTLLASMRRVSDSAPEPAASMYRKSVHAGDEDAVERPS
jgi:hypothetical protein